MATVVSITNPITGVVEQVDKLDHTAQEIDDAIARALPGGAIDITLQKKADSSSVYTKSESISAETRTALSLAETATPDAALAEIARQLSERNLLWENASAGSEFVAQIISLDLSEYNYVEVEAGVVWSDVSASAIAIAKIGARMHYSLFCGATAGSEYNLFARSFLVSSDKIEFNNCRIGSNNYNFNLIPYRIYGLKGGMFS